MRKLLFTGWLYDMALDQAINFFSRIMGDFLNVRVATFAFYFGMHARIEYCFVDIQQSQFPVFIDPTQPRIFVTQEAIADIRAKGNRWCKQQEKTTETP